MTRWAVRFVSSSAPKGGDANDRRGPIAGDDHNAHALRLEELDRTFHDEENGADFQSLEEFARHVEELKVKLVRLLKTLKKDGKTIVGYGAPAKELLRLAGEEGLDLLVVGTHGHRLLGDLALGQTVAPLLHRSPIPILVVPTAPRGGSSVVRKVQREGT